MKINKCCNKNDQRTLNILKKNNKGLTAYGVLNELQKHKNIIIREVCSYQLYK